MHTIEKWSVTARACRTLLLLSLATIPATAQQPIGVMRPARALRVVEGALSFLVLGDWGRHGEYNQRRVAAAMDSTARKLDAAFVVATGDNFYPNGVASVLDPAWRLSFEDIYTGHALYEDWWVVLGNHDYRGNAQAQLEYGAISRRWRMPARYYSKRHMIDDTASVELFFLDTSPFIKEYRDEPGKYPEIARQDTVAQRRWLDSALTASTATWKLVVGHHHVYSGGKRETNADLEPVLVPRLDQHGVTAYISGHEHVLQHIAPPGQRAQYFISGAASEVRAPGNAPGTKYSEGRQGFLAFSVTAGEMLVQAVDYTGAVRYRTALARPLAACGVRPRTTSDSLSAASTCRERQERGTSHSSRRAGA